MSTISMTQGQVGALHDLAVAYDGFEIDATPAAHRSLDVVVYSRNGAGFTDIAVMASVSIAGTTRLREPVAA